MKREIAERWIAELESGKYEQGTGRLRTKDDRYCCLGVLCEIAIAEGVLAAPKLESENGYGQVIGGSYVYEGGLSGVLPKSVQIWAGMKSAGGDILGKGTDLVCLNDGYYPQKRKHTFKEIAQIIRENVDQL